MCEVEASDDDSSAELEYKISNTVCLNENGIEIDTSECENWFVVSLKVIDYNGIKKINYISSIFKHKQGRLK